MTKKHPDVRVYLAVFGALMVLTVVTVTVSWLHLPPAAAIMLGLAIAVFKAALVAAFFMHLKGERTLIYGLLGLALVFMAILFIIPISDSAGTADKRIHGPSSAEAEAHHVP